MSRSMNTPIGRSVVFFVVVVGGDGAGDGDGDGDCDGSRHDDEEAKNAARQLQLLSLSRCKSRRRVAAAAVVVVAGRNNFAAAFISDNIGLSRVASYSGIWVAVIEPTALLIPTYQTYVRLLSLPAQLHSSSAALSAISCCLF